MPDISFVVFPSRDHAFLENPKLQGRDDQRRFGRARYQAIDDDREACHRHGYDLARRWPSDRGTGRRDSLEVA